ncbi:MAG: hypothetical protein Q4C96_04975 [Planctomycetia bacterium]|nr:hypothetical protein [Planctomycetia bacterium]
MTQTQQFLFGPDLTLSVKSAHTYDFLALSREIKKSDLEEIASWSARGGECFAKYGVQNGMERVNWNFHPLPSGAYCVSQTLQLPYVTRQDSFTHGLIITPKILQNFANNPVLLIELLEKQGFWQAGAEVLRQLILYFREENYFKTEKFAYTQISDKKYPVLRMIPVEGSAEVVRTGFLRKTGENMGVFQLVSVLDAILQNVTTVITGKVSPLSLMKTIFDMLPVNCRPELSFSTKLSFSPERPFRVIFTGENIFEQKRVRQSFNLPQVSFSSGKNEGKKLRSLKNRWSIFMTAILQQKLERKWKEIQILDPSPCDMDDLADQAKIYMKKLGLKRFSESFRKSLPIEKVCFESRPVIEEKNLSQKSPENLLGLNENSPEKEYQIFKEKFMDEKSARQFLSDCFTDSFFIPVLTEASEMEECLNAYLACIVAAAVGNPLASEKMMKIHEHLLLRIPEEKKVDFSEELLEIGLRIWNIQKAEFPTRSYHQIEQMADILCEMITQKDFS